MLKNWIIYLVGPGGVGKLTVARQLARAAGCKVVDNHYWLNPIFGLLHQDGVTPLPKGIWPLADQVRSAVLETIAAYSPPDWSFVFTHSAVGIPDYYAADMIIARGLASVAERRRARKLAVRLTCAPDELMRRIATPERRDQMKGCDTEEARINASLPPFDPGWPETMTVDTTNLTAQQTTERVMARTKEVTAPT
ncbi:MAG TPA: AAA family ATPase [Dongiaceae bacterium]|jgi:hypothetical protein|nr:AAA family ATPase [Dongiaceae bacterium]